MKPVKYSTATLADSKYVFTLLRSCFSPGGRKRNMRTEWNGGSWNTADPTSLLSTNLCQTTSTSTTTVGPLETLNVSDILVLKQWHHSYCGVIHNVKGNAWKNASADEYKGKLKLRCSKWMLGHTLIDDYIWICTGLTTTTSNRELFRSINPCACVCLIGALKLNANLLAVSEQVHLCSYGLHIWYLKQSREMKSLMTAHKIMWFFVIYYYLMKSVTWKCKCLGFL